MPVAPSASLGVLLRSVVSAADLPRYIERDPVRFPRRYSDLRDVEIAGVYAALLAYGRAALFGAVLEDLFAAADAVGGPYAWIVAVNEGLPVTATYRWNKPDDFAFLARTLYRYYARYPTLGEAFVPGGMATSLGGAIEVLRSCAPGEPSRSCRPWFSHPADGSACKRWLMFMRWMVRREPPDLGVWSHLHPRDLLIPVDTHVNRISGLVGLTERRVADWRAAELITAALREHDPDDPVRFDFALAHLGISDACKGRFDADICPRCPLVPACAAAHSSGSHT